MFTKVDDPMPSGWPCPNPWPITKADLDPTVVTGSLFNMEPVRTNHKALLDCCASLTRRFWRHSIRSSVECGCGKLRRMWRSRIYWRRPLILKKMQGKPFGNAFPRLFLSGECHMQTSNPSGSMFNNQIVTSVRVPQYPTSMTPTNRILYIDNRPLNGP